MQLILRAHIWLAATAMPLLVRVVPLPRLLALLTPTRRPYRGLGEPAILDAVRRRLARPRMMRRRPCLREGLLAFHFLRLAGIDAVLRFSVNPRPPGPGRVMAHCWVSVGERCVSTPPAEGSVILLTYAGRSDICLRSISGIVD